jgi:hypothetical protein
MAAASDLQSRRMSSVSDPRHASSATAKSAKAESVRAPVEPASSSSSSSRGKRSCRRRYGSTVALAGSAMRATRLLSSARAELQARRSCFLPALLRSSTMARCSSAPSCSNSAHSGGALLVRSAIAAELGMVASRRVRVRSVCVCGDRYH